MKVLIPLIAIALLASCQKKINKTESDLKSKPMSAELKLQLNEIGILNAVLSDLVTNEKVKGITDSLNILEDSLDLYITDRMFVSDSVVIEKMIAAGAPISLWKLNREFARTKTFAVDRLSNVGNINVTDFAPMTTKEFDRFIGGVNFSRILFSDAGDEAKIIVHFQRYHLKSTYIFCLVSLKKESEFVWKIDNKLCLNN